MTKKLVNDVYLKRLFENKSHYEKKTSDRKKKHAQIFPNISKYRKEITCGQISISDQLYYHRSSNRKQNLKEHQQMRELYQLL